MMRTSAPSRAAALLAALVTCTVPAAALGDLVAHYPLDGNAIDATVNANHGTVVGAVPAVDRHGTPDSALAFDGDDHVDVPDHTALTLGGADFTITAWISMSVVGEYFVVGHDEGEYEVNKWLLFVRPDGFLFHVNSPSVDPYDAVAYSGWAPVADTWYHLAVRRSGSTFTLFADGLPVATGDDGRPLPDPATTFQIGTSEPGHPEWLFRGSIDEVRIYNHALSDQEILAMYDTPVERASWGSIKVDFR